MVPAVALAALLLQAGVAKPPAPPVSSGQEPALLEAQRLADLGKLSDAENAVRQYLGTNASSADAHYLLSYILFREQNPKASIAEYTEAARYRAPGALDLEVIGCDYLQLEDYAAADQWLTKSVGLNPQNAAAQYFLGRAKYNEKRFEEAVAAASTECLKLDPNNIKAADNLGHFLRRTGQDRGRTGGLPQSHCAGHRSQQSWAVPQPRHSACRESTPRRRPSHTSLKRFRSPLAIPEGTGSWEKRFCR